MVRLKTLFVFCMLSVFTILAISCSNNDNPTSAGSSQPQIKSLQPDTGSVGTVVVISGRNFANDPENVEVTFNGTSASVTSANKVALEAIVPKGATSGGVKVSINNRQSSEATFTVVEDTSGNGPKITYLNPDSASTGSSITIDGVNFSATASENTVTFNGTSAEVTSASETQLKVTVPQKATTGPIEVKVNGQTISSATFTVTLPPPVISSISPQSGMVGENIIIKGNNFSINAEDNIVSFNDSVANVTNASRTQLKATIPEEATTGLVKVIVKGQEGVSSSPFTVKYPAPTITGFSPQEARLGASVTINGKNFSPRVKNNSITFNGTHAEVLSATETQLKTMVPLKATKGPVKVTAHGKTATSSAFTLKIPKSLSIVNFEAQKKKFDGITAVKYSWDITNSSGNDFRCKLDADGDGEPDFTINSCPESGSQLWLYRKKLSPAQFTPELNVSASSSNSKDSKSLASSLQISAKRIADISAGRKQAVALSDQNKVTAWGIDDERTNVPGSVQNNAIGIATSLNNTFFLKGDNTVEGVGDNSEQQLDTPTAVQGHAVSISTGNKFGIALLDDGTVAGWGINSVGETTIPSGLDNVVAIASGKSHTIALKADGTIAAWGLNDNGQSNPPAELKDEGNVVAIAGSSINSQALRFDGSVTVWGGGSATNVPSNLGTVVDIAGSGTKKFQMVLQANGTIRNWGGFSKLDKPGIPNVIDISAEHGYGLALQDNGAVVGWGFPGNEGQNNDDNNTPPQTLDLIH